MSGGLSGGGADDDRVGLAHFAAKVDNNCRWGLSV